MEANIVIRFLVAGGWLTLTYLFVLAWRNERGLFSGVRIFGMVLSAGWAAWYLITGISLTVGFRLPPVVRSGELQTGLMIPTIAFVALNLYYSRRVIRVLEREQ